MEFFAVLAGEAPGDDRVGAALAAVPNAAACILSGAVVFFAPDSKEKGVSHMITWSELFQFCAIVIALISLVVQIIDKKKK